MACSHTITGWRDSKLTNELQLEGAFPIGLEGRRKERPRSESGESWGKLTGFVLNPKRNAKGAAHTTI